MSLLISALCLGFIFALLALGTFISFRIFSLPDITVDGTLALGGAITASLIVTGTPPLLATLAGGAGGMLAGSITGLLQTRFGINPLLSGILVMTGLYSVNLHIMGRSNIPLTGAHTLRDLATSAVYKVSKGPFISVAGWQVPAEELAILIGVATIAIITATLLYFFFRTNLGTAMRASGNNEQMTRALGVNVENYRIAGLALANGLAALSGALLVQYQGFADVQMGIGMIVVGLASVIIGEALTRSSSLALALAGTVLGTLLFRELLAIALRWGLNPNDLKLATALFVLIALVGPNVIRRLAARRSAPQPC